MEVSRNVFIKIGADNCVTFMHKTPLDPVNGLHKTKEELEKIGIFATVPEPDIIKTSAKGMAAIPYYNTETKQVYYQYKAVPMTVEQRLELLEKAFTDHLLHEHS